MSSNGADEHSNDKASRKHIPVNFLGNNQNHNEENHQNNQVNNIDSKGNGKNSFSFSSGSSFPQMVKILKSLKKDFDSFRSNQYYTNLLFFSILIINLAILIRNIII